MRDQQPRRVEVTDALGRPATVSLRLENGQVTFSTPPGGGEGFYLTSEQLRDLIAAARETADQLDVAGHSWVGAR